MVVWKIGVNIYRKEPSEAGKELNVEVNSWPLKPANYLQDSLSATSDGWMVGLAGMVLMARMARMAG